MRLFYAIPLEQRIQREFGRAMDGMRPCFQRGRFSPEENLHVTLAFLGETPPERLKPAREALDAVSARPFPLCVGGIGCFRRPGGDIYWAGVERTPALCRVHDSLCRELKGRGFPLEKRPFRPHLTLVRQAVLNTGCTRGALAIPTMRMQVSSLCLMLSERGEKSMKYTAIHEIKLKGDGKP